MIPVTQIATQTQHQAVDREGSLAEAERIGPLLREHAAEGETQRRPAQATIEALREAGVLPLAGAALARRARGRPGDVRR